jgi:two-component system LytT family sensor kinase
LTVTFVVDAREGIALQVTETARLNEELSKAQLAALRRQLEPHFMYNTLNSIAGLVRDQKGDAAVSMIVGLSEFLRRASEDSHRSQVTLAEEVEYLQRYLDIQKVRFGERLQVSVDMCRQNLLRAQVPNLLLQPLVENAIKHGISKRVAGGAVRVAGTCHNGSLCLSVYNDGPTLLTDWQENAHWRRHRQSAHPIADPSRQRIRVATESPASGGVEVVVTLPFTRCKWHLSTTDLFPYGPWWSTTSPWRGVT